MQPPIHPGCFQTEGEVQLPMERRMGKAQAQLVELNDLARFFQATRDPEPSVPEPLGKAGWPGRCVGAMISVGAIAIAGA